MERPTLVPAHLAGTAVETETSDPAIDLNAVLASNRTGPGETTLTVAELLRRHG
jgi:hypothetical protein